MATTPERVVLTTALKGQAGAEPGRTVRCSRSRANPTQGIPNYSRPWGGDLRGLQVGRTENTRRGVSAAGGPHAQSLLEQAFGGTLQFPTCVGCDWSALCRGRRAGRSSAATLSVPQPQRRELIRQRAATPSRSKRKQPRRSVSGPRCRSLKNGNHRTRRTGEGCEYDIFHGLVFREGR